MRGNGVIGIGPRAISEERIAPHIVGRARPLAHRRLVDLRRGRSGRAEIAAQAAQGRGNARLDLVGFL
jgi:hypothetical protein